MASGGRFLLPHAALLLLLLLRSSAEPNPHASSFQQRKWVRAPIEMGLLAMEKAMNEFNGHHSNGLTNPILPSNALLSDDRSPPTTRHQRSLSLAVVQSSSSSFDWLAELKNFAISLAEFFELDLLRRGPDIQSFFFDKNIQSS
ncbi:hypothetical protein AXF42_Ash014489 [Apostasia shenzhenica]|uniref:Uncharacterized protein n=1 Tax=Apostasia shenzhenica TaxID=1088818 RepID=A0A2H9ZWR6_9ASPA|nr:hypothetical protein AXF42_Ash014489 [Apostasia shenzhenica]